MKVNIHGKNIRISNYLSDLVEKKISKLDRFFPEDSEAQVKLTVEKNRHICEVSIPYASATIRAKDVSGDMYASIDAVVEKLEKQVVHYRTKLEKRHRQPTSVDLPQDSALHEEEERKVVRTKTFDLKPMSVEEAALQMQVLDHDFFVFFNDAADQINVLYLRDDGNLGLIQPAANA